MHFYFVWRDRTVAKTAVQIHVCPSVCPHASPRLPLDTFCWNLTLGTCTKICRDNSNLVKIRQNIGHFTWRPNQVYTFFLVELPPTRCKVSWFINFYRSSTCFRWFLRPSSGAHTCTYCFRYCQPILLLAAIVDRLVASSSTGWQ